MLPSQFEPARHRRNKVTSTIGAAFLSMTAALQIGMGFLVIPGTERFGVSTAQFLIWLSIFTLSTAVMLIPSGRLMVRFGVRSVVTISALLVTVTFVAMSVAPSMEVFYILSAVLGAGWSGCTNLAATSLVTTWYSERRGIAMGAVVACIGLSGVVMGFAFPRVIAASGFTGFLLTLAGITLALAVGSGIFLVRNAPAPATEELPLAKTTQRRGVLAGFGLIVALLTTAAVIFSLEQPFSQIQPAAYASFGVDPVTAGVYLSYYSLCSALAKPVIGFLFDKMRLGVLVLVLSASFLCGLPVLAILGHNVDWIFWLLLPIMALSLSIPTLILPLMTGEAVGQARYPIAFSFVSAGSLAGLAVGAPLWGLIFDLTGSYDLAMMAAGIVGPTALAIAYAALTISRRRQARAAVAPITAGSVPETVEAH